MICEYSIFPLSATLGPIAELAGMTGMALQAAGNVGRVVEHGDDHGPGSDAVGNPIAARLHPGPAAPGKARIRTRGGKPGGGIVLDEALRHVQRDQESADGFIALAFFVVSDEGVNLTRGPRRVGNQRPGKGTGERCSVAARFASIRAMLSRRR